MAMGIKEKTSPSQMIKAPDGIPHVLSSSIAFPSYHSIFGLKAGGSAKGVYRTKCLMSMPALGLSYGVKPGAE